VNLFDLFIKKTNKTGLQFFRYIGVGGFAAVVNIGSLVVCKEVFGIYYLIANTIGFFLGLITNYLLSKIFVFTDKTSLNRTSEFVLHGLISGIGLGLDTFFVWGLTSFLGFYYVLSKILSTGIVFIWNFIARKKIYVIKGVITDE
jgi:putative flippase GtrA